MICRQIVKELDIKLEDAFVDGTKLKANAKIQIRMEADSYTLCEDGTITCLIGSKGVVGTIENRHPIKKNPCSMSSKDALDVPLPTVAKGSPEIKQGLQNLRSRQGHAEVQTADDVQSAFPQRD